MILTSLRCFLNHLCQLTSLDTILRSYYYVIDVEDPLFETNMEFNSNGQIGFRNGLVNEPRPPKMNNNYRIQYIRDLNPTAHTSDIMTVNGHDPTLADKINHYVHHLTRPKVLSNIYCDLFNKPKEESEATILIMFDEENALVFGDIIAQYLSQTFGEDVFFIDPMLRPDVKGNRDGFYKGNIANANKYIKFCKDVKLRHDIENMISEYSYEDTFANLSSLFAGYSMRDLFDIYEHYFPDRPLPPGQYQQTEIIEMLIHNVTKGLEFHSDMGYEDINPNITQYETALSEFEAATKGYNSELINYNDLPF